MKLFFSPGACSMGIHLLLEEIGAPYETELVSSRNGDTRRPPYTNLNPKGRVPALLRDDGRVVTEYPVVAHWLASAFPAAGLLPPAGDPALTAAELTDYIVSTVHMQGFTRVFKPENFGPSPADHGAVQARGRDIIDDAFALLDGQMAGTDWVASTYSYADSALFYVAYWGAKRLELTLPPNLASHFGRMMARPAVARMLQQEGLTA